MRFHFLPGQGQAGFGLGAGVVVCGIRHYIAAEHVPAGTCHARRTGHPRGYSLPSVDRHWSRGHGAYRHTGVPRTRYILAHILYFHPNSFDNRTEIGVIVNLKFGKYCKLFKIAIPSPKTDISPFGNSIFQSSFRPFLPKLCF